MIRGFPAFALAALGLAAGLPDAPEESTLRAYPDSVSLETLRDLQRLVVLEELPDGTWLDRTAEAPILVAERHVERPRVELDRAPPRLERDAPT